MAATDLTISGGVVTIDFSDGSSLYRVNTTESVTAWSHSGETDGQSALIAVTRNPGHAVAWTGFIDLWLNAPPPLNEGETIYFPITFDASQVVANATGRPKDKHFLAGLDVGVPEEEIGG